MGKIFDIYYEESAIVFTFLQIFSIGITGASDDEYYATALHLRLSKLELTTSISWRK